MWLQHLQLGVLAVHVEQVQEGLPLGAAAEVVERQMQHLLRLTDEWEDVGVTQRLGAESETVRNTVEGKKVGEELFQACCNTLLRAHVDARAVSAKSNLHHERGLQN